MKATQKHICKDCGKDLARELGSTVTGRVRATNGKIIIDAR